MSRRPLACLAALLLGAAGCAQTPSSPSQGGAVAVWDLEDLAGASSGRPDLGEALAGQVIEALQERGYQVVERQRLILLLEELRLGSSSLADEGTRLRLGRLSGARWMVFGGYQTLGGQLRLDLRLVQVETGRVLKAAQRTVPAGNLLQEMEAARGAARELVPGGG